MSLAFFLCLLLSFDRIPLTSAGPQSSAYLSSYLSALIPTCAQSCLEDFVAMSFPSSICEDNGDLSCLCTRSSASGFTLGEGALRCVASACTNPQSSDFTAAYDACAGIPRSLPMTHGTLTATMARPSTIILGNGRTVSTTSGGGSSPSLISASASVASSTISPSDTITSSPPNLITATASPSILSGSSITFTESGTTLIMNTFTTLPSLSPSITAAAGTSSTAAPQPVLTTAQIAGVAVAGSATAALALGLLFFLFCVKRKHDINKRHSGSSFGGDEILETFHELSSDPAIAPRMLEAGHVGAKAPPKPQQYLGVPIIYHNRTWGTSRQSLRSPDIGVAMTPENITHEVSPISATSYRTTSNLLPDKPNYNLFPTPAHSQPPLRPERPAIRQVENPELRLIPPVPPGKPARQTWQPMDTSQAALQRYSQQHSRVPSDPFKDTASDPREMMYALERKRASRAQLPRIITPASQQQQQVKRGSWNTQPGSLYPPAPQRDILKAAFPPKPIHQYPSQLRPISEASSPASNLARPQLPAFDSSSSSNSSTQAQLFRSAPYRSKSGGKRPLTHYTSASDTSFEDDGDEEEGVLLPPLVGLSPVQESPESRNKTPLSQIKYPVIHTSSPPPRRLSPETPTRQPPTRLQPQLAPIKILTPTRLQPQLVAISKPSPSPKGAQGKDKQLPATPTREPLSEFMPGNRHGQQHPVELEAGPLPLSNLNSTTPRSAKWQILCSPGLEGLENTISPRTVRTVRSDERNSRTGTVGTPRTVRTVKSDERTTPRMGNGSPHIWG